MLKVDVTRSPPFANSIPIPTFAINRHVRKRILLRINPLIRNDIRISMANLILHKDINAVTEMQPPEAAVLGVRRRVLVVVLKRHLAQLVEAVRLVQHVEGAPIQLLVALGQAGEVGREFDCRFGVFAERDDVRARDGEDVFRFEGFPDGVDFGAAFGARVGRILGCP